jgi:hypothetical protein
MKDALEGWQDARADKARRLVEEAQRMYFLLVRAERELLGVLNNINEDRIPHDGDDFHELLRDIREVIESAS